MSELIRTKTDERGVASLILNRPDKHNALSGDMCDEIKAAAQELESDPSVRVVILKAEGKSFCAGGDLGWMKSQIEATSEERKAEAKRLAGMLQVLNHLQKPLIARVHGNAFGGGVGIMCCCDHVIATDGATFGLTETRLGLIPATIGPYVAARLGLRQARQIFMSSEIFGRETALRLGLVDRAVPADSLDDTVNRQAEYYLNCAPGAVARAKNQLLALGPKIDQLVIDASIEALTDTWEGSEALPGITAFFAKEEPPWRARPQKPPKNP